MWQKSTNLGCFHWLLFLEQSSWCSYGINQRFKPVEQKDIFAPKVIQSLSFLKQEDTCNSWLLVAIRCCIYQDHQLPYSFDWNEIRFHVITQNLHVSFLYLTIFSKTLMFFHSFLIGNYFCSPGILLLRNSLLVLVIAFWVTKLPPKFRGWKQQTFIISPVLCQEFGSRLVNAFDLGLLKQQ